MHAGKEAALRAHAAEQEQQRDNGARLVEGGAVRLGDALGRQRQVVARHAKARRRQVPHRRRQHQRIGGERVRVRAALLQQRALRERLMRMRLRQRRSDGSRGIDERASSRPLLARQRRAPRGPLERRLVMSCGLITLKGASCSEVVLNQAHMHRRSG